MQARITLIGRIGEPNLRFTPQGKAVISFGLVTERRFKNKQTDEWESADTTWWNCEAWEHFAENLAENLQKGDPVVAIGTVHEQTWEKDGQTHRKMVVRLERCGIDFSVKANGQKASRPGGDPWATSGGFSDEPPF